MLRKTLTILFPLMVAASATWAANSGVPIIDGTLNTLGRVAQACGVMIGGVGAIGIIHHIRSGSWLGAMEHLGLATGGGAIVYNYPAVSAAFGGGAAALIHAAPHIAKLVS